ncbi:MAG: imidazole glycerol phosphate synthase subunit HisH [Anaerolineae bacterium]|nr:imidazole glycerol phosphate synthase subunit HisH [Anaerolineae bacterium]
MIAIIDYGAGNLRSVTNTLKYLGAEVTIAGKPEQLQGADRIVLPGVGAFGAGITALREAGFEEPIKQAVAGGAPLLGICLGMQYLFDESEEMGIHKGLGLLPGRVVRFPPDVPKVPHIGWNQLHIQSKSPLLEGVADGSYAYFVHSFVAEPAEPADILAQTDYGVMFTSIAGRGNVFGIQCHPEKSQAVGQQILRNFMEMASDG